MYSSGPILLQPAAPLVPWITAHCYVCAQFNVPKTIRSLCPPERYKLHFIYQTVSLSATEYCSVKERGVLFSAVH